MHFSYRSRIYIGWYNCKLFTLKKKLYNIFLFLQAETYNTYYMSVTSKQKLMNESQPEFQNS